MSSTTLPARTASTLPPSVLLPRAPLATPPGSLLFRPGPALGPEAHRIARALLEDAARHRGGRVMPAEDGAWRLEGAPPVLEEARRALAAVLTGRDAALVTEAVASPATLVAPPVGEGPERLLALRPLASLLRRRAILGFGGGAMPRLAGVRLHPSTRAVQAAIGPRWAGAPWLDHARGLVARRALAEMPSAARETAPVHLDLLPEDLPPPEARAAGPMPLPVLPPRALAEPPRGPFAIAGLSPEALALMDPARLPEAVLHLRHGPGLMALPDTIWAAIGPDRVVLEGVADRAALEWGLVRGIGRFAGPQADRILAAAGLRA
ncbi:hypothetical protein [Muricoccus radiodurans]|uniref:hypothetical protein n=1 Tax=Muricoccus radiodurans TaxID=2231721 RepID=UPI003CEB4E17